MTTIKNIIFDCGGVLVDWNPRYFYRSYFNDDEEMEYFLSNICTTEWNAEHDRGVSFAENISQLQAKHPEWSEAIGMFRTGWESMMRSYIPESVELLKKLKAQGFHLYGLTNWSAETIPVAYKRFGFFSFFEGIVVSGEEGFIKPDLRLYNILLERYQLVPTECIFIDDNELNVTAANTLGIHGIYFTGALSVKASICAITK